MEKLFLAIGNRELENHLKGILDTEVQFVGETVYREGVKKGIRQFAPTVIILKESLKGSIDMLRLIYEIRTEFPDVRIICIGPDKHDTDSFYGALVNYGVYDLVVGGKIKVADIIARIRIPAKYADVRHYQPAPPKASSPYPAADTQTSITIIEEAEEEVNVASEETEQTGEKDELEEKTEETAAEAPVKESLIGRLMKRAKNASTIKPSKPKKKEEEPEPQESAGGVVEEEEKTVSAVEVKKEEKKLLQKRYLSIKEEPKQEVVDISSSEFSEDKIITFIGGRSGVGTTTVAVNTAFDLAMKGFKVLYLEVNRMHPSAAYWFDTGREKEGIDVALQAIENKEYEKVCESIVRAEELKNTAGPMMSVYAKYPETLDFMSYSGGYLMNMFEKETLPELKELYLYLLSQEQYDFVVVDMSFYSNERDIQEAMLYSNKIFTVLNQDVSTVGYHLAFLKKLEQDGVNIKEKNNYIINSYARSRFGKKDLMKWLNIEDVLTIPSSTTELSESNSSGLPIVLFMKRSDFASSISKITDIIGGR